MDITDITEDTMCIVLYSSQLFCLNKKTIDSKLSVFCLPYGLNKLIYLHIKLTLLSTKQDIDVINHSVKYYFNGVKFPNNMTMNKAFSGLDKHTRFITHTSRLGLILLS